MNDFKFYKKINGQQINIKFIYDNYFCDKEGNIYEPRLRAILSGLDSNYKEDDGRIGHKDFSVKRGELASKINKNETDADAILKEGEERAEEILRNNNSLETSDNPAILNLIGKIENFFKRI